MIESVVRSRFVVWALDYDLSRRRHFPAINWTRSFSLYDFSDWYTRELTTEWRKLTTGAMALLQREVELLEIVQLVGSDALAENERAELLAARMLREDFLQQSAYHPVDRFCTMNKAYRMLRVVMDFYNHTVAALEFGVSLDKIARLPVIENIVRMKELPADTAEEELKVLLDRIRLSFAELGGE